MKKLLLIAIAVLAAAVSCKKANEGSGKVTPSETGQELKIWARTPNGAVWSENDLIGLYTSDDFNVRCAVDYMEAGKEDRALFKGSVSKDASVFGAYYPYDPDAGEQFDALRVMIPEAVRFGDAPVRFDMAPYVEGQAIALSFVSKLAKVKLVFSDVEGSAVDGIDLSEITITGQRNMVGLYSANLIQPSQMLAALGGSNVLTVDMTGQKMVESLEINASIAAMWKGGDRIEVSLNGGEYSTELLLPNSVEEGDEVVLSVSAGVFNPKISVLWHYAISSRFAGQYPAVDSQGNVYFTAFSDTKLYKLSRDGELLWSEEIGFSGDQKTSPSVEADGSAVYATGGTGGTGVLRAFNSDGSTKWTLESKDFFNKDSDGAPNFNYTTPAIGDKCVYIGNAGGTGTVLSVDKATGARVAYVSNADGTSGPAGGAYTGVSVSKSGVVAWAASYGLFGASKAELDQPGQENEYYGAYVPWGFRKGPNWNSGNPWKSVNPNMGIACTELDGKDYFVFPAVEQTSSGAYNLRLYWEEAPANLGKSAPGISQNWLKEVKVSGIGKQDQGGVVIGPKGEAIVSLKKNPSTGKGGIVAYLPTGDLAYSFEVGAEDVGGAAAVDNNGYVHVMADWTGDYFILKPDYEQHSCEVVAQANLRELAKGEDQSLTAERIRTWTSVVIGNDGRMYVAGSAVENGVQTGYLMCLSYPATTGPCAESAWPMRAADACHSGRQK